MERQALIAPGKSTKPRPSQTRHVVIETCKKSSKRSRCSPSAMIPSTMYKTFNGLLDRFSAFCKLDTESETKDQRKVLNGSGRSNLAVCFVKFTPEKITAAPSFEFALESPVGSVNRHEQIVLAFRVRQVKHRAPFTAMDATVEELKKRARTSVFTQRWALPTCGNGRMSRKPGVWPKPQSMSNNVWTRWHAHTGNFVTFLAADWAALVTQCELQCGSPGHDAKLLAQSNHEAFEERLRDGQDPLWSFAKFRGRPSFATPLIGFWAHGTRQHIHPAVTVGGPYWHLVCDGFHVFLVLGQYIKIVVIMRLRILATIAIDRLFENIKTGMAITREATSAQAASPSPTTIGVDLASAFSFGVKSPYTSLKRAPFRPAPFGFILECNWTLADRHRDPPHKVSRPDEPLASPPHAPA